MSSLVACTRTRGFKVRDLEVVQLLSCTTMPRARNFLLLSFILIVSMFMALCLWNWRNTEEGDPLTEPQKHIPGLRSDLELVHVFGQDRILGTLVTHVLHPQRREHVRVPHSDPRILVSVKTTTAYHRQRLSLLLFTWMESVSPQQVQIYVTSR